MCETRRGQKLLTQQSAAVSRTHAHTHARTRTRTHAHTHARTHAHTHARTRTRTHARTHARSRRPLTWSRIVPLFHRTNGESRSQREQRDPEDPPPRFQWLPRPLLHCDVHVQCHRAQRELRCCAAKIEHNVNARQDMRDTAPHARTYTTRRTALRLPSIDRCCYRHLAPQTPLVQ
jgi:hypothetical protein